MDRGVPGGVWWRRLGPRLERPHACMDGWVSIGQIVVDPETGEETEEFALYLCRKCAERS